LNAGGQFLFHQRLIRPGLRTVFQVLEHLRLHMRNKLGLPLVNKGGVRRPFQHPFCLFDAQRMERIMERLPVWPAL